MKIYTAAKYGQMEEMREVRRHLVTAGHEVTAQWIDGGEEGEDGVEKGTGRTLEQAAVMDVDDVVRADVLLFFSQPFGSSNTGGGRHWELGFAYALGKRCIVVGAKEIVFHHLPQIEVYPTLGQAVKALEDGRGATRVLDRPLTANETLLGLVQPTQTCAGDVCKVPAYDTTGTAEMGDDG